MFLRAGKLQVNVPLNPLKEQDQTTVFSRELLHLRGVRIAIGLGPVRPYPAVRIPLVKPPVERKIHGKTVEQFAFPGHVSFEFSPPFRPSWRTAYKLAESHLQDPKLQSPHLLIFHVL